jgi:hypothetical protein
MSDQDFVYDVAISFVNQDLALAQALYDELSKGLKVFFFPRNQEELAGSDGLESMRAPFRTQSRLNLVLYRPRWGNTPWTGVEEIAIKESCLATSFKNIFFFVIEPTIKIPTWLPETHVRFNFADFTLEQAVGAIKARVQERGGHFKPMTPSRKAALLQVEEEYQRDRRQIYSYEGGRKIFENVEFLFGEIVAQLESVNADGRLDIEHQIKLHFGDMDQSCLLGMQRLGMAIVWFQRYNTLNEDAALIVREFNENLIVPEGTVRLQQPEMLKEVKYDPDISRAREYVWRTKRGKGELITSRDLAAKLVLQFLELFERDQAGKIKRKGWNKR